MIAVRVLWVIRIFEIEEALIHPVIIIDPIGTSTFNQSVPYRLVAAHTVYPWIANDYRAFR